MEASLYGFIFALYIGIVFVVISFKLDEIVKLLKVISSRTRSN